MMRMYDDHLLHDVSGDKKGKNDNKNIAFHMEEGDGILHSPQSHDTNTAMDAAYIYHPNDVIPRKKKSRQSPRTVLTCLAVCTSASPLSSGGQNHIPNYPSPQRRHRRRPLLLLTSLLVMCITVAALWYIQETDVIDLSNKVEDNMNDEANKKLPKILQFDHDNDPNYYEPETKIVVSPTLSSSSPSSNSNTTHSDCSLKNSPSFNFLETNVSWSSYGQELVQHISEKHGIANIEGGQYSKHFGYGNNVILSADGTMMAISYEGVAGFDKAFGTHIDILRFHPTTRQWILEQTVTNVKRHQGYASTEILFQSMILSYNGQRLFFADGHGGVHVYVYSNKNKQQYPWKKHVNIPDPYLQQHNNSKQYQFGIDLATNCDGTMVAISGTTHTNSYTRIYQETDASTGKAWNMIGEIQNVRFGGNIVMDQSGTRLVIGTVASEGWRGMVQVFDYQNHESSKSWVRIGPPIVGKKPLDMWGGKVALSYDGNILAVTSKNGDTNHVQVYQLSTTTSHGNQPSGVQPQPMWLPIGPELIGTGNPYEHYGSDIAISADGTVLAVGAPGDNILYHTMTNGKNISSHDRPFTSGRIYLYQLYNSSTTTNVTWVRIDQNDLISVKDGDLYGQSVSVSSDGTMIVGGAPRRTGKAYQHILGGVHGYIVSLSDSI